MSTAVIAGLGFVVVVVAIVVWFALAYIRQQEIIHAEGLETELEAPQPREPRYTRYTRR